MSPGRFSPTQCGQWLCLLTISVTCCVFVTQPFMVGLVALGFAWKRRDDESFFTESLQEATEGLGTGLAGLSCTHASHTPCCSRPRGPGVVERVLAERHRARRLRRARPPCTAWLRATRERMRRQTRTRAVLRDTCMSVLMLLLHLLITHVTSPRDEHSLSHAIRNTFTRGARSSSGSLSSVDAWWDWSLTTLLDGVYPVSVPSAQVGFPLLHHCSGRGCGNHASTAHAVLTGLRAHRWVDHRTRAMSVHFVLYNAPTRLFSRVSLHATLLPAGGLALSPLVESVTVFHSDPAPRYHLLLPQLAFLALTLTHLCLQLFHLAEKGVRGYWQKRGAWLELPLAGAGLAWYAASGHLLSLAGEVTNQLHMGLLQGFVDLSPMASWNQKVNVAAFPLQLAGVLVLAAHAHLRGIPLLTMAPSSGTFADASHRFPGSSQRDMFPGLSKAEGQATARHCTALLAAVTTLWIGMNPSLDEFADLLDELLLKIDSLSARLPVPLPAQPPQDAPQAEAGAEGSPSLGASDDQAAGVST
ncbi:Polycystic kidney disease protein 1-like 1 [Myotis davidii]|uniref:Polycystic kidney disease protein 1-like 1 n=1 Tax=Myotis davidii TaxID=225400 RepID=L5LH08_MYODS|nr:Polycystic kidney disease protein 1-like 1 [Myotis davidii]